MAFAWWKAVKGASLQILSFCYIIKEKITEFTIFCGLILIRMKYFP